MLLVPYSPVASPWPLTGSSKIVECQFLFHSLLSCIRHFKLYRCTCLCIWQVIHSSVALKIFKTLGAFVPKSCENTPQTPCIALCHLTGKPGKRCAFRRRIGSAGPDVRWWLFGQFCFTAWTRIFVHLGDRVSFTDLLPHVASKTMGAFVPKSCENGSEEPRIAEWRLTGGPGER